LSQYWATVAERLRSGEIWRLNPMAFAWNAAREIRSVAVFILALAMERH
jgi:hypothetical protein